MYLNAERITRIKIDEVQDGIRVRFYEGQVQVAKSHTFESVDAAQKWVEKTMNQK
ncbi:MAG: sodium-dependent tyrosine transporter [Sulfurospirillum sp.]|nr:sodium-dependent tyrosine transporter [Sulfurospirillum sp.]